MSRVAFLHPDLGIGGAERLILDAVKAVKYSNPQTSVWTCRYESDRAFKDASEHEIHIHGNYIPRNLFGMFHILFSLLRFLWLSIVCALKSNADIFIVDQISACLPILRLLRPKAKIIFYCHFPDLLLAKHDSIRKIYRIPFDFLEKTGIKCSDIILVNSKFTAGKVERYLGITNVDVLYPCVDCSHKADRKKPADPVYVSLNRYEIKKNHALAVEALAEVVKKYSNAKLIIAGGYDTKVSENIINYNELQNIAKYNKLENNVELRKNISDAEKWQLIAESTAVIYTPQNEHFGIVPLEALAVGTPVIGCNSGGPLETINTDGCAICEPNKQAFADAMIRIFEDSVDRTDDFKKHALKFGFDDFRKQWDDQIKKVMNK
ncbi:glycosyl transferase [Tritrichomonas foetus]|uniref:Alpha-1,3/1,6-mannosyltransferase ALG2 n=1 Tax=Tritrichomonas foetus TaxID=1144522 RepID=A0A1J4JJP7_9EUKA|nr:glycosyl transferase [Tritrichomonas foetus]|eukprot:OHS98567.1 glycosyl transferase [Tritrichomonas foetus]